MSFSFEGKRALVTGAGKGIGRALAKDLAKTGAKTFALSRTLSDLESLKRECPEIDIIHCDLADFTKLEAHIQSCLPIDLLVNNAAVVNHQSFLNVSVEKYDKQMNVNVKSPFLVSQIVARDMTNRETGGSIVNVSSVASSQGIHLFSVYSMTKAALDQMTRSMALELAPFKIRVNSVLPTGIKTEILKSLDESTTSAMVQKIPLGRLGEIKEVTSVIMFLLSDQASLITGSCIPVDGGSLSAL